MDLWEFTLVVTAKLVKLGHGRDFASLWLHPHSDLQQNFIVFPS